MFRKVLTLIILISTISTAQNRFAFSMTDEQDLNLRMKKPLMLNTLLRIDNLDRKGHSAFNIAGQAVAGVGLSAVFSIVPLSGAFASAFSGKKEGGDFLGVLAIAAYLVGTATGVDWIASLENEENSFLGTLGYTAIGGCAGAIILGVMSSQYTSIPAPWSIIAVLSPLAGAMAYSNLIAPWPSEKEEVALQRSILSHKDFYERGKLFNMEVIRISF